MKEIDRLRGIVDAIESTEPDSCFNKEQNRHRTIARQVQDRVLGSRKVARERIEVAVEALRYYAEKEDVERARIALAFIERPEDPEPL